MKLQPHLPQDQVFWYVDKKPLPALRTSISVDVAIIGGGMAGLSAAQACKNKGLNVALIEKNYCGSGASGKSSGFITPDSELSLWHLVNKYGTTEAKKLWDFIASGTHLIKNNIEQFNIECDYQIQDTLVLANTLKAFKDDIEFEHMQRTKEGYKSELYNQNQLAAIIGSDQYKGGISYANTFGIHAYEYCNGMKKELVKQGVAIYEETAALEIQHQLIKTAFGNIKANRIIVCIDRFAQSLPALKDNIFQAQTFLLLSAPLSKEEAANVFPNKHFMAWDTEDIYTYFRLTSNNRLLLGGASLLDTFTWQERHNNSRAANKLINYWHKKFPHVPAQFEYMWPGLIGITKDLFPIAGFDESDSSIYYIAGASGLPWAAALGMHSAECITNKNTDLDTYFSPYRHFKIGSWVQKILGKPLTFALSNLLTVKGF